MDEKLKQVLVEKKTAIVDRWFDAIAETYPDNTSSFLKHNKARFTNPVGYNTRQGVEGLFDALLQEMIPDSVSMFLDDIIRIRAVQDFTPSAAVAFVFVLKRIVREELKKEIREHRLAEDLDAFDSTVDDLALFAFDVYMRCREKIYEIKAKEVQNATFRLLQRAKRMEGGGDEQKK